MFASRLRATPQHIPAVTAALDAVHLSLGAGTRNTVRRSERDGAPLHVFGAAAGIAPIREVLTGVVRDERMQHPAV